MTEEEQLRQKIQGHRDWKASKLEEANDWESSQINKIRGQAANWRDWIHRKFQENVSPLKSRLADLNSSWSYEGLRTADFNFQPRDGRWDEARKRVAVIGWHAARTKIAEQMAAERGQWWPEQRLENLRTVTPGDLAIVLRRDQKGSRGLYAFDVDGTLAVGWSPQDRKSIHVGDIIAEETQDWTRTAYVHELFHLFAAWFNFNWGHGTEDVVAGPAKRMWREEAARLGLRDVVDWEAPAKGDSGGEITTEADAADGDGA